MLSEELPADVYYFAKLTPTNHTGTLWVVSILSLIYGLMSCALRFTLRRGMYGLDDAAIFVSMVASLVQHAFVFLAISYGLGATQYADNAPLHVLSEYSYLRVVFAFLVHCLAKVSLTLFIRRLFYGQAIFNRYICNAVLVSNILWCVFSILLLSINCRHSWYFATEDVCPGLITRWAVIKLLDVLTEVNLIFAPMFLISRILINRKHKLIVVCTFAARIPVIYFTLEHYFRLKKSLHTTGADRGFALASPVLWLQVELLWSMVTASLPSFKPLITPFDTIVQPVESTDSPSNPMAIRTSIFMGPENDQKNDLALTTWTSANANALQTQLSNTEATSTWRPDFKAYTETTVVSPKKRFFGISLDKKNDIEMGQIHHGKSVEIRYDRAP